MAFVHKDHVFIAEAGGGNRFIAVFVAQLGVLQDSYFISRGKHSASAFLVDGGRDAGGSEIINVLQG